MFNINNNSETIKFSGSQFDGLENKGTKHLVIRTGVNPNDVKKYGLTSTPLNNKYSNLKMRISTGGGGQ